MTAKMRFLNHLFLFFVFIVGGLLFWHWRYFPTWQFLVVVGVVLIYWAWGIWHHAWEKRLAVPIILEYVFIGALVILMFALALNIHF